MLRNKIGFCMLFCFVFLYAGGPVPDTTKSSGKISNILTNPDNLKKLEAIGMTVTYVAEGTKYINEIKKNGGDKKPDIKGKLKGMAITKKHSKAGFFIFMKNVQEDILDILNKATDKIDVWRTTEPTIQGWSDASRKIADDTKTAFKDFRLDSLWDREGEWSRKMGKVFSANIRNFNGYIKGETAETNPASYLDRYVPQFSHYDTNIIKIEKKEIDSNYVNAKAYLFYGLPKNEIMTGISGLITSDEIMREARSNENGEIDQNIKDILRDNEATYLDEVSLLAYIKQLRTEVEYQRATLQQQQSHMAQIYARNQLTKQEKQSAMQSHHYREIRDVFIIKDEESEEGD